MAIAFDYANSIINLTAPEKDLLLMQDLINAIRVMEASDEGMQYPQIALAEGKADIGGGVVADITITLLGNWQIQYEAGTYQGVMKGGQVVGGLSGNPVAYTPGVQVKMIQSVAGTIIATGSGVTEQDKTDIMNKVLNAVLSDYSTDGTLGKAVEDIHAADYNKRVYNSGTNRITIYEADKTTVRKEFDTNSDLSDIDPV